MAATLPDYEQAGELKIGQVGIANLRVRTRDVEKLAGEMRDRVARAPKLFARAAVIIDFGGQLGKTFTMKNFAVIPFPSGGPVGFGAPDATADGLVMQFRVSQPSTTSVEPSQ